MLDKLGKLLGLLRPAGTRREIIAQGVATPVSIRLPHGSRWQWAVPGGVAATMGLRYGDLPLGALEVLAGGGLSRVHVHPGLDVFVEVNAPAGTRVWIFTGPNYSRSN